MAVHLTEGAIVQDSNGVGTISFIFTVTYSIMNDDGSFNISFIILHFIALTEYKS